MFCTSGFVNDVICPHNAAEVCDIVWSSSPGDGTSRRPRRAHGAKSAILNCRVYFTTIQRCVYVRYMPLNAFYLLIYVITAITAQVNGVAFSTPSLILVVPNLQTVPSVSIPTKYMYYLIISAVAQRVVLDLRSTGRGHGGLKSYSWQKLRYNLRQVVHTYVPLSPSSITWYRPRSADSLRLGR